MLFQENLHIWYTPGEEEYPHNPSYVTPNCIPAADSLPRTRLQGEDSMPGTRHPFHPSRHLLILTAFLLLISAALAQSGPQQALRGTVEEIRAAVAAGADIEARDADGLTPLMHAAGENSPDAILLLVEAGADLEARDPYGWTPLMRAASFNAPAAIGTLLEAGADVEARDDLGWTPLMIAVMNNQPEAAEALLQGGADLEARDGGGWTALMLGSGLGYPETVEVLLDAGADPHAADSAGRTAYHYGQENRRMSGTAAFQRLAAAHE
jgi:ankyrin repeat protein